MTFYSLGLFVSLIGAITADYYSDYLNLHASIIYGLDNVAFIYALSVIVFLIPWLLVPSQKAVNRNKVVESYNIKLHMNLLVCVLVFVICLIMLILGRVPIVDMALGELTIQQHIDSLSNLPIGMMAILSMCTVIFILMFSSAMGSDVSYREINKIKKLHLFVFGILLVFLCVWQGTRQFILLAFFLLFIRKMQQEEFRLKNYILLVLSVAIFIGVFIKIQDVRLQGKGTHSFELLMYLAWPPLNLSSIVENINEVGVNYFPSYIFWEIIPNRLFGKDLMVDLGRVLFEPSSPSGYLALWYLDFGVYGIVLGSLLLSVISLFAFLRRGRSENNLRINNMFLWVCITSSVYSHLLHLNFFIAPMVALILYGAFTKKVSFEKNMYIGVRYKKS